MSGIRKGIYILPNLFTTGNLFLGFYAIIQAIENLQAGDNTFRVCAIAIIFAAVLDTLDGRVANMTNTASRFGVEYDSISDVVSFGVAPALVMFLWSLSSFGRIGWVACFLYVGCAAMRLARYNVQSSSVEKTHFEGIPTPMAAFMLCGVMLIFNGRELGDVAYPYIGTVKYYVLGLVILLALLMVSNFRYRNFRSLFLTKKLPFYYLLFVFVGVMIWAIKPLWTIFIMGLGYIFLGLGETCYAWAKGIPASSMDGPKKRRRRRRRRRFKRPEDWE
jgi:CDP-diacylglycerol--serine O-phosphatidyltransferase